MNRADTARAEIARLLDLEAAATPGPWRAGEHYNIHLYADQQPLGTMLATADAALIVAARNGYAQRLRDDLAVLDRHAERPIDMCRQCFGQHWPCPDADAVLRRYTGDET